MDWTEWATSQAWRGTCRMKPPSAQSNGIRGGFTGAMNKTFTDAHVYILRETTAAEYLLFYLKRDNKAS